MTSDLVEYLTKYRGRALLLDANLLVVFTVGLHEPYAITRHKRTKGDYEPDDYHLIVDLIEFFGEAVTTPNVLTEVSNLLAQRNLSKGFQQALFGSLAHVIAFLTEHYVSSKDIRSRDQFGAFGLTDIGILQIASAKKRLVVTADSGLATYLRTEEIAVENFGTLRDLNMS